MQMAAAYAAVANGGVWTQPHLVDAGRRPAGRGSKQRRVLRPGGRRRAADACCAASSEGDSGRLAAVPGYQVAGKTGTAREAGRPTAATRRRSTSRRSSGSSRRATPRARDPRRRRRAARRRSTAAPSRRRRSSRSPASTCSTSASRRTPSRRARPLGTSATVRALRGVLRYRRGDSAMTGMPLAALGSAAGGRIAGDAPVEVARPRVPTPTPSTPGALFFCVPRRARRRARLRRRGGRARRGRARRRAASSTSPCRSSSSPTSRAGDGRRGATPSSATRARELDVAGVTGTNGKTTTAFLAPRDPRGGRPAARPARHGREPRRRRAAARRAHDARGDRPAAHAARDARRRRPQLRARGHLARLGAAAGSTACASPRSCSRT